MAKLNHAKIIKGFEELINTTNGKDFEDVRFFVSRR